MDMRFQVGSKRGDVRAQQRQKIANQNKRTIRVKVNPEKVKRWTEQLEKTEKPGKKMRWQDAIFHPDGMRKFDANGYADWPPDNFTCNRIRDGDVIVCDADAGRIGFSAAKEIDHEPSSSDAARYAGSAPAQSSGTTAAPTPTSDPQRTDAAQG
jgi:hypothetical protein